MRLLRSGQAGAATMALTAAVRADDQNFEAHHALGAALAQSGRFSEASQILARAAALRPDSAPVQAMLGGAYDRQNLHEAAIAAFRRAVELKPDFGPAHHRLAELYTLQSQPDAAAHHLDRAADAAPASLQARLYRSDARLLRGDLAGAERCAREAVAAEPTSAAAQGTLGGLLYARGCFEAAADRFAAALRLDPKLAKCWDGLVHCRRYEDANDPMLGRLRAVLERDDLTDDERMTLHFAAGKVCDDRGDHAGAMEQFDKANTLRARRGEFDRMKFAAHVDRTIAAFPREVIARNAISGVADGRPLFIVGMYRSGTTLVEQILSRHPSIVAGGELTVWTPAEMEVGLATGAFDVVAGRASAAKYLARLDSLAPSAAHVTDKLPFNFLRLGAICSLMPNARIVHCRRDPIDTCLSIHTTLFNTKVSFAARKPDLVFCYRQYLRMMDHWRAVLPRERFLEIDYERLVEDPEAQSRQLITFTNLDWRDECLSPERNERPIATASAWQARQPLNAGSVRRWRHYEPWLQELRDLLPGDCVEPS